MAIPYQLESILRDSLFNVGRNNQWCSPSRLPITYDNHNCFQKALIINVSNKEEFFVPTPALPKLASKLGGIVEEETVDITFLYRLFERGRTEKKTAAAIFKYMFNCYQHLQLVHITGGTKEYIGGNGIVMDSNWNPMMLSGYMVSFFRALNSWVITEPRLYVHPSVFKDTDVVSKTIVKHVIPYCSRHRYQSCAGCTNVVDISSESSTRIIVEDFSHMLYSPSAPNTLNFNRDIQKLLINKFPKNDN